MGAKIKLWAGDNLPIRWQNAYTGEIFCTLIGALITAIADYRHYPSCRTIEVFHIVRTGEE